MELIGASSELRVARSFWTAPSLGGKEVLDGDPSTSWRSAERQSEGQWLAFDLGHAVAIGAVDVQGTGQDTVKHFALEGAHHADFREVVARSGTCEMKGVFLESCGFWVASDNLQRFAVTGLRQPVRYVRMQLLSNFGNVQHIAVGRVVLHEHLPQNDTIADCVHCAAAAPEPKPEPERAQPAYPAARRWVLTTFEHFSQGVRGITFTQTGSHRTASS